MADFDLTDNDNKQRIVYTFINSIYLYDDRLVINFNCRENPETIPLELSVFGSDFNLLGEPLLKPRRYVIYGVLCFRKIIGNFMNIYFYK